MTLPQPLSHSAALPEWLEQPLSHSGRVAEWLSGCSSGWGEIFRHCVLNLMFNTRNLKSNIIPTQSLTSEPFGTFVHFLLLRRGATERYSKQKKRSTSINYSLILQFHPIPIPDNPRLLQFPDAFLCFHPDSADHFATDCP